MERIILFLLLFTAPLFAATLEEAVEAYNQKDYAKAYSVLETLTQGGTQESKIYLLMGHCAVKLDKWEPAEAAFKKASELDPESPASHIQLGFLYEKLKQPEKARNAWEKVLILAKSDRAKKLAQKHLENLK